MRSFLFRAASAIGFLLLLCALPSAPAAAQSGCTTTYNCQGNSGCISVMGGNITHRSITEYTDQPSCVAAAGKIMATQPLPSIECSCGGSGTGNSDLGSNIGKLVGTMTPQQQMGAAVGAVGTLMILKGLSEMMQPKPVDPAVQQRALAAQQLNNSGIYLLKQKDYAGAINEFQQALAQTPNDTAIKNNLALAQQRQKNVALAGKTSGALGQVLGEPQPSMGPANSGSPLSMVNLNGNASDPNAAQPQGGTQSKEAVENQIDGALGNAPATPQGAAGPAQTADIDKIFNPSQAAPAQPPQAQVEAEKNQVDDLFKQPGGSAQADENLKDAVADSHANPNGASAPDGSQATAGTGTHVFGTSNANPANAPAQLQPNLQTATQAAPGADVNALHQAQAAAGGSMKGAANGDAEAGANVAGTPFDRGGNRSDGAALIQVSTPAATPVLTPGTTALAAHIPDAAKSDPSIQQNMAYYQKLDSQKMETQAKLAAVQRQINSGTGDTQILNVQKATLTNDLNRDNTDEATTVSQIKKVVVNRNLQWNEDPAPANAPNTATASSAPGTR